MQVIKKKERIEIYIEDIVYGGNGISRQVHQNTKDFIIFIKNGIQGQTVLAEIIKLKAQLKRKFNIYLREIQNTGID